MKRGRNNKKGVTLVELIAVIAISVVILGAACAALYAGARSAAAGTAGYANHGTAGLLENWIRTAASTAQSVSVTEEDGSGESGTVYRFRFDGGSFVVEKDGAVQMRIDGIERLTVSVQPVDAAGGGRQKLDYTVRARNRDGAFSVAGGIVLNNAGSGAEFASEEITAENGKELHIVQPS